MTIVDKGERRLRARIGGLALASKRNPHEYTAKARLTFLSKFEGQVDPHGALPPAERQRRAEAAKKLHFSQLALKSVKARRSRSQRRCEVAR